MTLYRGLGLRPMWEKKSGQSQTNKNPQYLPFAMYISETAPDVWILIDAPKMWKSGWPCDKAIVMFERQYICTQVIYVCHMYMLVVYLVRGICNGVIMLRMPALSWLRPFLYIERKLRIVITCRINWLLHYATELNFIDGKFRSFLSCIWNNKFLNSISVDYLWLMYEIYIYLEMRREIVSIKASHNLPSSH